MARTPIPETTVDTEASGNTRTRLLLAAMELFAEHGVEGTSLRRINELADCRNSSAVHYHFGGRDNLIGAVLEFIGSRWDMSRVGEHHLTSTGALLELIGRSLLDMRNTMPWGYSAIRFMQRLITERDPRMQALWRVHFGKHLEPMVQALAALNPGLARGTLRLRLIIATVALINGIAGLDAYYRTALGDVREDRTDEQMLAEILRFVVGGLVAPEPEAT